MILLALALAGCSEVSTPYEWSALAPRKGADDSVPRVGICYNAMFTTPEAVRATAAEACSGLGAPQFVEQDMRLGCPLLTPVRATFACLPESSSR